MSPFTILKSPATFRNKDIQILLFDATAFIDPHELQTDQFSVKLNALVKPPSDSSFRDSRMFGCSPDWVIRTHRS
ncbi:unnamed protein product, partial [marine sediment metagenome]